MENVFNSSRFENGGLTLVDFWASWCGPCKMQAPVLESFAKSHPEIKVVKVNVDEENELAVMAGISAIPTLIVVKNGAAVKTAVGFHDEAGLEALIASCNG